ncbi:MAG: glycosyltransferase, partial [Candidatus Kapaibacterium sp.]
MHILVLTIYSGALFILLLFGFHTAVLVWHYYNTKPSKPVSLKLPTDSDLPIVTIQLPIYNEHHVVKRILDAVCNFNYPNDKLEIQILDDSTDDTVEIISKLVSEKILLGLDIKHIHRLNRDGYKA